MRQYNSKSILGVLVTNSIIRQNNVPNTFYISRRLSADVRWARNYYIERSIEVRENGQRLNANFTHRRNLTGGGGLRGLRLLDVLNKSTQSLRIHLAPIQPLRKFEKNEE